MNSQRLHEKVSNTTAHFNGRMELRLCFVTSLLSWTSLRFCDSTSFFGKVLDRNTNLTLLGKMAEEISPVGRALFACFPLFLSNCRLANFNEENVVGTASFLSTSWRSLKEGPNKTPYCNILFEAVFGKMFCTNARMLRGCKLILFIFISHFL